MRGELDVLAHAIDRVIMPRRSGMMAGGGDLRSVTNLLRFPRRGGKR
jgi:hypothetical protein